MVTHSKVGSSEKSSLHVASRWMRICFINYNAKATVWFCGSRRRGWVCFARNVPHCSHLLKDPELWEVQFLELVLFYHLKTPLKVLRGALFVVNKNLVLHHNDLYWIIIFVFCSHQWTAFKVLRTTFCISAPTNQEAMRSTGDPDY